MTYNIHHRFKEHTYNEPIEGKKWLMDLSSHGVVIGKTGYGKSNYLLQIIRHLNGQSCNIVLIDPHGSTSDLALKISDKNKIFLSGRDYRGSENVYSGVNILRSTGQMESANRIGDWVRQAILQDEGISAGTWGPRINVVFSVFLVEAMMKVPGLTLNSFVDFLLDRKRFKAYVAEDSESIVSKTATAIESTRSVTWIDFVLSSLSKLFPILENPLVRRVISVEDSDAVDIDDIITSRKDQIIIPDLNVGLIGKNSARAITTFILARIWNALLQKGPTSYKTYIIIDEAHLLPEEILEILIAEGRKYGVVLILAYQKLGSRQMSEDLRGIIFSNVNNFACFAMSAEDAEIVSTELIPPIGRIDIPATLSRQDKYDVTVISTDVKSRDPTLPSSLHYGPVTLMAEHISEDYSREELDAIKASIIREIGYSEEKPPEETTAVTHSKMIYQLRDFLLSRNIEAITEPDIGGLVPDVLVNYNGKNIYCEVEVSDLLVTNRIAKKMKDYMGERLFFLCRNEEIEKLVSIIGLILENAEKGVSYSNVEEEVPASVLPEALLRTSILAIKQGELYFYNGSSLVKFSRTHLEAESSFMSRLKRLPLGNYREKVMRNAVTMISSGGKIDLDKLEQIEGREKLRTLLQSIRERGYQHGLTLTSLLEMDRIKQQISLDQS